MIILDLHAGEYYGLAAAEADSWEKLVGSDFSQEDRPLFGEIEALGWLDRRVWPALPQTRGSKKPLPASAVRAFFILLGARRLVARGFECAYIRAAHRARTRRLGAVLPIEEALQKFHRAEKLLPSPLGLHDCLPRSLALFVFLAESGYFVTHYIGVKRFPFAGHAWVATESGPVNADMQSVESYTPIVTMSA